MSSSVTSSAPLSPLLQGWRARGDVAEIYGREVFYLDTGGPELPCLVILHGFPSSSYDFHRVVDRLARRFRVVIHDHLGFGLSAKPETYSYSLLEQAEVAVELWRQLGLPRAHLLAHDYGTSVATEILARRERGLLSTELASVTLANGSVFLELARLRLSQRLARSPRIGPLFTRLLSRAAFGRVIARLWGDPARLPASEIDAMWAGLVYRDGLRRGTQLSCYLDERVRFRERWIEPLRRLDLPAHVLWARRDPIAVPAIAERLAREVPKAELTWLEELGHYPMLEDPDPWASEALGFLGRHEPGAREA